MRPNTQPYNDIFNASPIGIMVEDLNGQSGQNKLQCNWRGTQAKFISSSVIRAKDSTSQHQDDAEAWASRACKNAFAWSVGRL